MLATSGGNRKLVGLVDVDASTEVETSDSWVYLDVQQGFDTHNASARDLMRTDFVVD